MGLDVEYEADGAKLTHRLSHADWAAVAAVRAHLPADVGVCFDAPEPGVPARVPRAALAAAAAAVDRFLAAHAHLLPATYQFKFERFPVPGVAANGFDTGGFSGLRLPGDPDHVYWLQAGLNELVLRKYALAADGTGVMVEERDLRNETELITESAGRVRFRRRAAKTTLRRALREIAAFAGRAASDELTKTVG